MRHINLHKNYKKHLKQLMKNNKLKLDDEFIYNLFIELARGNNLEDKYKDHQLTGDKKDLREFHIKGDICIIYFYTDNDLEILDIGTHRDLGLGENLINIRK